MKNIRESIGFTPKILKKIFAWNMFFTYKKVIKREKTAIKFFRLSRTVAAAVDKIFLDAYSLDHKT
jgi:hypothetical protein